MAKLLKQKGYLVLREEWCRDDILDQAEEMRKNITAEQADQALELMARTYDSQIGINWEVISCAIDYVTEPLTQEADEAKWNNT
jgi:hypothetical protein